MPTALIVEDEPEANRLLALLVQMRGYRTESAFTGGEAMELARRHRPDIVFLDLMLPDTTGFDVCSALKAAPETTLVPVVIVTARVESENRLESVRAGASEYVPKPYTPDEIFQALSTADSWRRDVEGHPPEGAIALGGRDEAGPLVQLARLRSLLLARTPIAPEAVGRLGSALMGLAQPLGDWARRHRAEPAATLRYRIGPDRTELALRDEAGWSSADDFPRASTLGPLLDAGASGEVTTREGGREVVLSWSHPPGQS